MTRYFFNADVAATLEGPVAMWGPLQYHRKLPGYAPTPLIQAPEIARAAGVGTVWVKDESHRMSLPSFKILGASWGVFRALEERIGSLPPWKDVEELADRLTPYRPLALAAATDGNHGRAVARMAKMLKLDAWIFVPQGTAPARIEGIESDGASCEVVEGTYDDTVARSATEASANCLVISDTSWEGYTDVPAWVIEGYSTIFWEVEDRLRALGERGPDLVVVQMGVGALAAAAGRHFRRPEAEPRPAMVGIEPERAACVLASIEAGEVISIPGPHDSIMAGLNCGTPSVVAWPVVSRAYDLYMAIGDDRARDGMRLLAEAGIVSGETGAAGVGGLIELLTTPGADERRDRLGINDATRVLLLSTEGATDPAAYEAIVGRPPVTGEPQT